MIRINLLPVRAARKQQAGQRQLAVMVLLVAAVLAGLFFLHSIKSEELDKKKRVISELNREIASLKKEVGDFGRLRRQRDRLMAQRRAINELHKGRTGPVYLLREFSEILSVGKGPTVDRDSYERLLRRDPAAGYDPNWNPRRLWINRLDQKGNVIGISGAAKDHDDVAELLKRLKLSVLFSNVVLHRNDQYADRGAGLKLVRFSMTCVMR
jgi:type IV pilus assembly protein PilN